MTLRALILSFCLLWHTGYLHGQQRPVKYDLVQLSQKGKIQVHNREASAFSENGKNGLRLSAKENDGIVWLNDLNFSNGVIELDIKGKDVLQQSFVGVAFHGADTKKFDAVYFRPFNFRAEDSVRRIHAVQYISQPEFTWQRLREEHNGKYEKAIVPVVDPNEWFHVKIVVQHPQVSVFVNQESRPSLIVEQLSTLKNGKIGLWVGHQSGGDFANLTITNR